jgi:hypothetical protein
MSNNYQNFLIKNLILTIILIICGVILFSTILKNYYHDIYLVLLLVALIDNLIIFKLALKKNKVNQSLLILILSFAIKFFTYLLISIVYFIHVNELVYRGAYIFVLFIVFIAYTSLEIKMLSNFFKSNS